MSTTREMSLFEYIGHLPPNHRAALDLKKLQAENAKLRAALRVFENRRKLAHSLRVESPHIAAFVSAIGAEMDKQLACAERKED